MAIKKNDVLNAYANTNVGNYINNGEATSPSQNDVTLDALAKAKSEQNYKSYFNNAMQLYNAENNAKKYLGNQLANQGLNTQGYGSSQMSGINNTALNAYANNQINFANNQQDIIADNQTRLDEQDTEKDNQLVTLINDYSNGDVDTINKYLQNYGYMDANGNYTDSWNSMDKTRQAYITSLIDNATSGNNTNFQSTYGDLNSLNAGTFTDKTGKIESVGTKFGTETEAMFSNLAEGKYSNGEVVKLVNGWGVDIYFKLTKNGFVRATEDDYNKTTKRSQIRNGVEVKNK